MRHALGSNRAEYGRRRDLQIKESWAIAIQAKAERWGAALVAIDRDDRNSKSGNKQEA